MKNILGLLLLAIFASNTAYCQLPQNGLVFHLPFNNSTSDSSTNQIDTNSELNINFTEDRFGERNEAGVFNGFDSYIKMSSNAVLDFSTNKKFSAGFWFNADKNQLETLNEKAIFSIDADCGKFSSSFQLREDSNMFYGIHGNGISNNNGCWSNSSNTSNLNSWHLVTVVLTDAEYNVYLDAQLMSTTILNSADFDYYASNIMVGAWSSRGSSTIDNYYTGLLDDVFIYDRTLSPAEITDIYNYTTVSTYELQANNLKVFPNPVVNQLTIEAGNNLSTTIKIFNTSGAIIYEELVNNTSTINTSNWAKGVYVIQSQNNGVITYNKVVK